MSHQKTVGETIDYKLIVWLHFITATVLTRVSHHTVPIQAGLPVMGVRVGDWARYIPGV